MSALLPPGKCEAGRMGYRVWLKEVYCVTRFHHEDLKGAEMNRQVYLKRLAAIMAAGLVGASPALGAAYVELVPWSTIQNGESSSFHYGAVVEGQTSFHQLSLNNSPAITRVDNLNGSQSATTLVTPAQWGAATGGNTSLTSFYGFSISGDYLQFADVSSDEVWRVHKSTGAITQYASQANIKAETGETSVQVLSPFDTNPLNGEMAFYDGASDSILITSGANTVNTLVSSSQLISLTTTATVSGGMGYDAAGTLYWANRDVDSIYKRADDGTLGTVLTQSEIVAVTGEASADFGDILPAADGLVYFYETRSDSILSFDPSNPAGSLSFFITEQELIDGPMGSDNVVSLAWYDGNLGWHTFGASSFFVVPEPTSLALLAIASLFVHRRRR